MVKIRFFLKFILYTLLAMKKLKSSEVSTLKLDVSELSVDFYNFDKNQIIYAVINNINCKKLIYNKR